MVGLYLYAAGLLAISLTMPATWFESASPEFVLAIGTIAIWRYGWGATHVVRSLIYRHYVFPKWRRAADALGKGGLPDHVYLLVTSFRIDSNLTFEVYRAALLEAMELDVPVTLVASVVEMGDQRLIKELYRRLNPPPHVALAFVRIAGTGKRDALAQGFRAIAQKYPPDNAVVAVIDGDSILDEGLLRRTLPFFKTHPRMDALTTDETCEVDGAAIFRDWYNLRFAQRHLLMSSMGLSRRVLTLTGRMSMFRGSIATDPAFIAQIEQDSIHHWRLGRFRFLTGDDKSTWYHLLKRGSEMIYIPDARVITVEQPPHPRFLTAASMLMRRWFGNMLRTNGRALALGPSRMGAFVFYAIFDQRISMWTSLIGPTGALLASIFITPFAILFYIYWVALTRFIQTIILLTVRSDVKWNYPFLIYFNQIFGSAVKTYVSFRLDRQKWTRQNTSFAGGADALLNRLTASSSVAMHVVSVLIFVTLLGAYMGIFRVPAPSTLKLIY